LEKQAEQAEKVLQKNGSWASRTTEITGSADMESGLITGKTAVGRTIHVPENREVVQPGKGQERRRTGVFPVMDSLAGKPGKMKNPRNGKDFSSPAQACAKFDAESPGTDRIFGKTKIAGRLTRVNLDRRRKIPADRTVLPFRLYPQAVSGKIGVFFKNFPVVFFYLPKHKNPQRIPNHHIYERNIVTPGDRGGLKIVRRFYKAPIFVFIFLLPGVIQQFLNDKYPFQMRRNVNTTAIGYPSQFLRSKAIEIGPDKTRSIHTGHHHGKKRQLMSMALRLRASSRTGGSRPGAKRGKIAGQRGAYINTPGKTGQTFGNVEPEGVKQQTLKAHSSPEGLVKAEVPVLVIPRNGMPGIGQMAAYLVCPPGFQFQLQPGTLPSPRKRKTPQHTVPCP
jgi:hypothetical protein